MKKVYKIIIRVLAVLLIVVGLIDIKALWWSTLIGVVIGAITFKKVKTPAEIKPREKTTFTFFVAGTTFEQQDGKTGQEILAKVPAQILKDRDEKLYAGFTLKDMEAESLTEVDQYFGQEFNVDIEEYMYENEIAVRVFLVDDNNVKYQIGNIKRSDIELFRDIYSKRKYMDLEIAGGKVKSILGGTEERPFTPVLYIYI